MYAWLSTAGEMRGRRHAGCLLHEMVQIRRPWAEVEEMDARLEWMLEYGDSHATASA